MIGREKYSEAAIAQRLTYLLLAILILFGAVALALAYWSVVRTEVLAERPDNPRGLEAEYRVQRGSILDRNNVVLAENGGPANQQERLYPLTESGPAVGYYSLRYGASGIEESYDTILRGADISSAESTLNELLHIPPSGRNVRMTLDATLQQAATQLMRDQQGALVLIELGGADEQPTADIRAMVSQPWYDPAELDALFEALAAGEDISFFNRATQGSYQPGLILFPLLTASAVTDGIIDPLDTVAEVNRLVEVDGLTERCLNPPEGETADWFDAVRGLCPGAAADLGELMGADNLADAFRALGLTTAPEIPIPTAETDEVVITDAAEAGLGQGTLTISPLQAALAYGALAGSGTLPQPRLVDAVQQPAGQWGIVDPTQSTTGAVFSGETAYRVRQVLPQEDTISGFSVPVVSAPNGQVNEWYVGVTPSVSPRYVAVVVLEQPEEVGTAETIGRGILTQASLQP
ncbi:MAG: penicillin-binding transpeptidase domain-containing protein [Chloroflexota bacterium]